MHNPQTSAFDALAPTYDTDFTHSPLARYLRQRIQTHLLTHFQAGQHLLELGCGTGEDALWLAQHGLHVTATDSSTEMLALAHEKTRHTQHVQTAWLDLAHLSADFVGSFDGVYSNFGPLNCIAEWQSLAKWLSQRVKHGGVLGFGIMARYCVWEVAWYSLHGEFKTAFRRLSGSSAFQLEAGGPSVTIYYPTIARLVQDFAPHFRYRGVQPLGVFIPPTALYQGIEARPRLMQRLIQLEERFGKSSPLALLADHYWIEFERV